MEGRSYLLRPEIPKEGKPRELRPEETEGELSGPVRAYADEAGLVMRRPSFTPYSQYALEATHYAKEQGAFDPFHRAMYKAYWEEAKNIGDFAVIRQVAESCDLDWSELESRLESRHYEQTVMDQYQEGIANGVQGIPGFIIGNILFTGARPYPLFQAVAKKYLEYR